MSIFDDVNPEASGGVVPIDGAQAKRLGFLGNLEAAYDTAVTAGSQYGVQQTLRNKEQENDARIRALGELPPPNLGEQGETGAPDIFDFNERTTPRTRNAYTNFVQNLMAQENQVASGSLASAYDDISGGRNARLQALQQKYPNAGIQSYDDMIAATRQEGRDAQRISDTAPTTFLGKIGGFIGGTAGQVDPRANPFTAATALATLPAMGEGATLGAAAGRVAGQGAAQAVGEAIGQFTGARQTRGFFGLETNTAEAIAGAAVGGAVGQGAGEVLGAGIRRVTGGRWFAPGADVPEAPVAPATLDAEPLALPPPALALPPGTEPVPDVPLGLPAPTTTRVLPETTRDAIDRALNDLPGAKTRLGNSRAKIDFDSVSADLADWGGPRALDLTAPADTRIRYPEPFRTPDIREALPTGGETLDQIARRLDPQTFSMYDLYAARKAGLQEQLRNFDAAARQADVASGAPEIRAQLAQMREDATSLKGKKLSTMQQRIADLEATLSSSPVGLAETHVANMNALRAELLKTDEKMREMAPTVTRAYARAQGRFGIYEEQRNQIRRMIEDGRSTLDGPLPNEPLPREPITTTVRKYPNEPVPAQEVVPPAPNTADEYFRQMNAGGPYHDIGIVHRLTQAEYDALPKPDPVVPVATTRDAIPELREGAIERGEDPVNAVRRVAEQTAKVMDDAQDEFRDRLQRYLEPKAPKEGEPDPNVLRVGGQDLHLDNDNITIPNANGEGERTVSIRQLLAETADDNFIEKAVTTCRIA